MSAVHALAVWLLVAGFVGAGVANGLALGHTREKLIRWGYPRWWCHLTGALEIATALLIALPATRLLGLLLGWTIVAAAIATVARHRERSEAAPLGAFVILLALGS